MITDTLLRFLLAGYTGPEVLTLLLSAFIAGAARGFSGFGAALIFMPLASAVIGPALAAALLLAIDAVMAVALIPDAWPRADRRGVGFMTLGAAVGIPAGTFILAWTDPLAVRWAIATVVGVLLAVLASGWRYHGQPSPAATVGVGSVSGVFTGVAQIGGPPVVVYWLGGTIPSAVVRANMVLYFAASTLLTGGSYLIGGLFTEPVFILALTTGPVYGLGLYCGSRLFWIASEITFRRICYGLIAVAAVIGLPIFDSILR